MGSVASSARCVGLAVVAICCALSARLACADMMYPEAAPPPDFRIAPLVVRASDDQVYSRILVPRRFLTDTVAGQRGIAAMSMENRTIVAGIALSVVMAAGGLGLVFIRRRRVRRLATAAIVLLAGGLCLMGTTLADLLPPNTGSHTESSEQPSGIAVQITDSGENVILVLDRTVASQLSAR
ncbi:MAG: hypothetical protein JXB62_00825 [Pirellulales bacterium]|nr:hypothetical protein [Pirellulales bacterium]